jgi:3-oxoacyl-[acyl-carrier-protein] synthase II
MSGKSRRPFDVSSRIFIAGTGLITPLGASVAHTWRAMLDGQFIRDHARVDFALPVLRETGSVRPLSQPSPGMPAEGENRVTRLAVAAARQALSDARWGADGLHDPQTALVVGTSKGPIESWLTAPPAQPIGRCVSPADSCFGLAELGAQLALEIGFGAGPRATLSGACASGIHALVHAILLMRSGAARRALVVAAEASVHPLFVGSFKRLGVLPAEGTGCRPFDESRGGFLVSEAAAALCVEIEPAERTGRILIDRFSLGADATHLTAPDPRGRALKHILSRVIDSRPIDLVHAHATGTALADPVELAAIESVVGESRPNVWSHKGALGHSLGAAGLVSVVLNCMSHATGIVPPNVQTRRPIPASRVRISNEPVHRPIRRSVAIASGFGGAMGAVSLAS